ncbi:MRG-domain-containing protein [Xylaria nigripes]|nr:MRG-domain-containing protein [Xylaria nigripes]
MAPSKQEKIPPYSKDEKVLCFHGDLMYEAKIIEVKVESGKKAEDAQYRIHYKGWKASWDDWVTHDRIRKLTDDNKQLAAQLQAQARMRAPGAKGGKKGVKAAGSEMSSTRGSEERAAASSSFAGRGPRRGRDYELEAHLQRNSPFFFYTQNEQDLARYEIQTKDLYYTRCSLGTSTVSRLTRASIMTVDSGSTASAEDTLEELPGRQPPTADVRTSVSKTYGAGIQKLEEEATNGLMTPPVSLASIKTNPSTSCVSITSPSPLSCKRTATPKSSSAKRIRIVLKKKDIHKKEDLPLAMRNFLEKEAQWAEKAAESDFLLRLPRPGHRYVNNRNRLAVNDTRFETPYRGVRDWEPFRTAGCPSNKPYAPYASAAEPCATSPPTLKPWASSGEASSLTADANLNSPGNPDTVSDATPSSAEDNDIPSADATLSLPENTGNMSTDATISLPEDADYLSFDSTSGSPQHLGSLSSDATISSPEDTGHMKDPDYLFSDSTSSSPRDPGYPSSDATISSPEGAGYRFPYSTSSFRDPEAFHTRPSIKLIIPDSIKALLVDDWENVTKNTQLVPIPHPKPVTKIIEDYAAYEMPKRLAGSSHADILEETLSGLREYFDKSLGRILLYKFERPQYAEMYKKLSSADPEFQGKTASDIYGAEHLCRLMVSLPELIAQTNMDQQSVNRLREELAKFCTWLSKNTADYFVNGYETPAPDYIDKAKN